MTPSWCQSASQQERSEYWTDGSQNVHTGKLGGLGGEGGAGTWTLMRMDEYQQSMAKSPSGSMFNMF